MLFRSDKESTAMGGVKGCGESAAMEGAEEHKEVTAIEA